MGSGWRSWRGWQTPEARRYKCELLYLGHVITSEQVARLEAALEAKKEQGDMELRKARHQLALAQAETHQAKQEGGQLKQALEDQRRENQILTEEVHQQNSKLDALKSERAGLEGDFEGSKAVVEQVNILICELRSHSMFFFSSCRDS